MSTFQYLSRAAALAGALLATPGLTAQETPRDPFASFAQGMILDSEQQLLEKPGGDRTSPPDLFQVPPAGSDAPEYRLAAMFGNLAEDVVIDAMSTGNDVLPIWVDFDNGQETFEIRQVPGYLTWASLMMSVDGTQGGGADAGSLLEQRVIDTGDRVGAELFNYWFPGNNSLASDLNDDPYFVQGAEHMRVDLGQDIVAFDSYMPIIFGMEGENDGLIAVVDRFYYSITMQAADNIRTHWSSTDISQVFDVDSDDVRGTTIFELQWNSSSRAWEPQGAAFLAATLGLDHEVDDIDALAFARLQQGVYGREGDGTPVVVFSLARVLQSHFDYAQIFAGRSGWHAPLQSDQGNGPPPQDPPGIPNTRNVDAICGFDPENVLSQWLGTPYRPTTTLPPTYGRIGFSAERYRDKAGQVELQMLATGLPASNGTLTIWGFNGSMARPVIALPTRGASKVSYRIPFNLGAGAFTVAFWAEFQDASGAGRSWNIALKH